jgi:hypothetical protein
MRSPNSAMMTKAEQSKYVKIHTAQVNVTLTATLYTYELIRENASAPQMSIDTLNYK